jgi:hypothetical protein
MTGLASTVPGPQGIQGERGFNGTDGVNGTQGPQGLPGITQLNDTNTYLITTTGVLNTQGSNNIGRALCDSVDNSGDFVVNGGFLVTAAQGSVGGIAETLNRPILSPLASGWEVQLLVDSVTAQAVQYSVYAICFDNPPLRP